jgi:hypothetical protein
VDYLNQTILGLKATANDKEKTKNEDQDTRMNRMSKEVIQKEENALKMLGKLKDLN